MLRATWRTCGSNNWKLFTQARVLGEPRRSRDPPVTQLSKTGLPAPRWSVRVSENASAVTTLIDSPRQHAFSQQGAEYEGVFTSDVFLR